MTTATDANQIIFDVEAYLGNALRICQTLSLVVADPTGVFLDLTVIVNLIMGIPALIAADIMALVANLRA
jgi:hypothetical protein